MSDHFAVVDVGSNALRLQLISVDEPGRYRILEQDREPVRLGHKVFDSGKLDSIACEDALAALGRFKKLADRYSVAAFRAVATSAVREATDGKSFLDQARAAGVPLEAISPEEEARLISLGVISGLRFDPPLGLFLDIGGGSMEISVTNRSQVFCLFSLSLGAVRLTERFIRKDPPEAHELKALRQFVVRAIRPVVRRLDREKSAMAFGSGGTITALADTDARLAGEPRAGSLYVLRRSRLQDLFNLLTGEAADQRAALLTGDPRRADIIVAGAMVLLEFMTQMGLDYIFVSNRGLRDGLTIDLLQKYYPGLATPWTEEGKQPESIEEVGEKYHYDALHSFHVSHLAGGLFYQLQSLHRLPERYAGILHAAAILHDIGLFIGYPKHHKHSYYLIKSSGPLTFCKADLDLIANIARYHRKAHPSPKHLSFSQLPATEQDIVRKLSALLRIADGLDRRHEAKVREVQCDLVRQKSLKITMVGHSDLGPELRAGEAKSELLAEIFNLEITIDGGARD
jgi:exopolyphosphatase/guanosine-5'-triphosphate,3'-diphosphate pyrophosphatase